MAAAAMTRGHPAAVIAAARMFERRQQTLLGRLGGQSRKIRHLHEPLARGPRIQLNYSHRKFIRRSNSNPSRGA